MQISDTFTYKGEQANAIALNRRLPFSPASNFGIATAAWATSNYRGFWCDYSIDETLKVKNLYLFSRDHSYPSINGQAAEKIPEFVKLILRINAEARTPWCYDDGFPMRYMDINCDVEYSGRIAIGVKPSSSKSGKRSYKRVYDLLFDSGILIEFTDITDIWKSADSCAGSNPGTCWWMERENDYYYLLNYRFMGIAPP